MGKAFLPPKTPDGVGLVCGPIPGVASLRSATPGWGTEFRWDSGEDNRFGAQS